MLTLLLESPFQPTRGITLQRYLAIRMSLLKYHGLFLLEIPLSVRFLLFVGLHVISLVEIYETGMALSRNTPCCKPQLNGHLAGLLEVILALRYHCSFSLQLLANIS